MLRIAPRRHETSTDTIARPFQRAREYVTRRSFLHRRGKETVDPAEKLWLFLATTIFPRRENGAGDMQGDCRLANVTVEFILKMVPSRSQSVAIFSPHEYSYQTTFFSQWIHRGIVIGSNRTGSLFGHGQGDFWLTREKKKFSRGN